ncbi:hypothetical protein CO615_08475 [Lysobacteraceae bacterium NML75-0749]|nr:hypothetical protein CO615_08475 [Xanthomonadaceae bacterium NML75-0749]PJK00392.1 hypothetical protein CO611_03580 [Xanthomonadaceae bacterium NML03-0222]PJK05135.1 hypothetical protein CO612_05140 [Xanthomonadaceae bacterium NML71-0210]PJK05672.1 hypothetical protein CO609_01555 [Xanthomonadaceae bacterium NML91-0268]
MLTAALGNHYAILAAMVTPALLITATSSLLISANNRLARVVDRLRTLIREWNSLPAESRAHADAQIARHRRRAHLVLRACRMLYLSLGMFVGTSLTLALDAFADFRMGMLPTLLAVLGVLLLLGASLWLWREVSLSVQSFDLELDHELAQHRQ